MPDPRQVFPLKFYMLSRRCTQRQFWLRPDDELNQIWRYCLAEAASRCDVEVVFSSVMSNHHHTIVIDRSNSLPRVLEFMEHLHKHVAKCVNALRAEVCEQSSAAFADFAPKMMFRRGPRDELEVGHADSTACAAPKRRCVRS